MAVEKKRLTKETDITLKLELHSEEESTIETGIGFFDHMLHALAKHSRTHVELRCTGDLNVDFHHTVEDVGIVLGSAFYEAVYPVLNIARFADRIAILDEAAVSCALDISGRPYLFCDLSLSGKIGDFDAELTAEFFRAFVSNMKIGAHITLLRGNNKHHIVEAAFKAFAIALRSALAVDGEVKAAPSTKGVL
ncbi:MAG: imidazoleglycerol-phosphate dehydratase HisB [Helicobacteraceae bacterium]|jgi:imidazoleglycerol-phosphate dehydratase|nr:imidazoleglycerol-phosphate dehydratase HisB [Helicobacteraceae bacterium]